jgi:hypothetical protein
MAVTIEELWISRNVSTGGSPQLEMAYLVSGTDDPIVAIEQDPTDPVTVDGISYFLKTKKVSRIAEDKHELRCVYEPATSTPVENDSAYSFDTGGGNTHIMNSLETVGRYPSGAADQHNMIGVTGDSVDGVDIQIPTFTFSETHWKGLAFVDAAYKAVVAGLTGQVNNASFKGFAAGEVLFLGASGQRRGEHLWEITYRFSAQKNKTGQTIGPITNIAKKGWEYLWVRYVEGGKEGSGALACTVKKPISVYVERVYESGDFSTLDIGTTA